MAAIVPRVIVAFGVEETVPKCCLLRGSQIENISRTAAEFLLARDIGISCRVCAVPFAWPEREVFPIDIRRHMTKRRLSIPDWFPDIDLSVEAERIDERERIVANIAIEVHFAAGEPDRVLADEPLEVRVVVARAVVVEVQRLVMLAAREPIRGGRRRHLRVSEWLVGHRALHAAR